MARKYPPGLGTAGRRLWKSILDDFELQVHEELTLIEACRVVDRLDALAEASKDAPLTVTNARGDKVASPYLVEARQQQIVYTRLVASLRLSTGVEGESRPGQHRGPRGAYQPRGLSAVN